MTAAGTALAGRTAIVTGAAQGIGRRVAERFADEGAWVVIADIQGDLAHEVADSILRNGGKALAIRTDVADAESVARMAERTRRDVGTVDILVNNAADMAGLRRQPFDRITEAEWDRTMAVNVKGMWLIVRAVAGDMREAGYGKIINMSSDLVLSGVPGMAHYVSSKGAIWALTRTLAHELGPDGIRVNAVAPGFTETESALRLGGDAPVRSITRRAIPRAETPDDLTGTMLYLASADSDFVTGQLIAVNGGSVLH